MAKKQAQTEFHRETKERIPVWMYPSTLAMMDGAIQQANCKSRSEFLEEAAKYYAGYVSAENAIQYLPPMLVSAFRGTIHYMTARTTSAVCCSSWRWRWTS